MTLSPGQKVQPKRSTRISPGGFSAFCSSMFSDRAPSPPRFIGQSTWTSRTGSSPKRRRDAVAHHGQELLAARLRVGRLDEVEVRALRRLEVRHLAAVDPVGVDDDPALGGLAEHLGQPHDRHRAGADDVGQHLPRPDRGQLVDVADEQQGGAVRQRLQQRPHQRHVDHAGLVDHQQVAVERLRPRRA